MPKEGQKEWEVEKIIQRGEQQGKTFYLVKWKGYPLKEATWQPITNLQNCQETIIAFERKLHQHTQALNKKKGSVKAFHSDPDSKPEEPIKDILCKQKAGNDDGNFLDTAEKTCQDPKFERETTSTQPQMFKEQNMTNFEKEDIEARHQKLETNPIQPQKELGIDERKRVKFCQEELEAIEPDVSKKVKKDDLAIRVPNEINSKNQLQQTNLHTSISIAQKSDKKEQKSEKNETRFFKSPSQISKDQKILYNQSFLMGNKKVSENDVKFDNLKHFYRNFTKDEENFQSDEPRPQESIQTQKSIAKAIRIYERYQYCDKELEDHQKITLMNIMRKIQQKERIKIPINIIDISKNQFLLKDLAGVKEIDQQCFMDSVDSLIKTSYGWLALGKSENQYVIVDVNLIKESSWNLLISIIAKRNKLRDQ